MFVVNSAVIVYNAALNRPAYQSSVYSDSLGTYPARYANDRRRHTRYDTGTFCAVTKKESNPWWAVDLGQPMEIYGVDLTTSRFSSKKKLILLA